MLSLRNMARYKKRNPDTIEATQWFKHGDHPKVTKHTNKSLGWLIRYPFCNKLVSPSDYIIKYDNGECDVQPKEEFELTFEKEL